MNQTILVALIGTAGIVVGAILSFLASTLTAQQKIKEIETTYRQKLDENYIANARLHIDTIYLPINIGLTKLATEYREFEVRYSTPYQTKLFYSEDELSLEEGLQEWEEKRELTTDHFRYACNEFLKQIAELNNTGKDAYLTIKLDEYLQIFSDFIKSSMYAEVPKIELQPLRWFRIPEYVRSYVHRHKAEHVLVYIKVLSQPSNNLFREVKLPYFKVHESKLDAAPLGSFYFRNRFLSDIDILKSLIKEVTLGASLSNKTH